MAIKPDSPIIRVTTRMSKDPDMSPEKFRHIKELDPRLVHHILCKDLAIELQNLKTTDYTFVPSPAENSAIIFNVVMEDINYPIMRYVEFERLYEERPVFNGMFFFLDQNSPFIDGDLKPGMRGHIFMTMPAMSLGGQDLSELAAGAFANIERDQYHVVFDVV